MTEILQYFGLPVGISSVSGRIDEIIVIALPDASALCRMGYFFIKVL